MNSNCCDEPIIENTDLCSLCKEHCDEKDDFDTIMSIEGKNIYYNGKLIKRGTR